MANKPKREAPNLANATQEFLIDEIAQLRDQMKDLEYLEGIYKEGLKSRLHDKDGNITPLTEQNKEAMADAIFKGNKNIMQIKYVSQARFNTEAFKADHPDLYAQYVKTIEFNQFKFTPLE